VAHISVADMKVGDVVKLITQHTWPTGIIVEEIGNVPNQPWFWVLQSDGRRVMWPESQMKMIDESR